MKFFIKLGVAYFFLKFLFSSDEPNLDSLFDSVKNKIRSL